MSVHTVTSALLDTLPLIYALAALSAVCVSVRPLRRVAYATLRFTRAHCPRWLAPVLAVCLAIPGPIDELAAVAIGLAIILRTSRNRTIYRRYVATAWHSSPDRSK
jgi:hypothetical protein